MAKYNRIQQGYPKAHGIDIVCVGESGVEVVLSPKMPVLTITAFGAQFRTSVPRGQTQLSPH
jgi:hypothetical protein